MSTGRPGALSRALHALFGGHADERRHETDRKRYRGTTVTATFDTYLVRVYGCSWLVAALVGGTAYLGAAAVAPAALRWLSNRTPLVPGASPPVLLAVGAALLAAAAGKRATVWLGGAYLRWAVRARRSAIERTLPGAVRYLHALGSGSDDGRGMLRKVATQRDAYGETAVEFAKVVNKVELTGSFDAAVRVVARDTPAQETLAPFLLKFREYADQGGDAVADFLRLESRMLGRRQTRQRREAEGFLELLAELVIVLLVLPTLLVIVLTVLGLLSPALSAPVPTPLGPVSARVLIVYGSGAFVLAVGGFAAWLVASLRPPNAAGATYERTPGWGGVGALLVNPADAAAWFLPVGPVAALGLWLAGVAPANAVLLGYAAYGVSVGLVALRRAHLDDAKDREIKDFVHAVAGHVSLGRPFPRAVALVAREVDLGALDRDVADLAFNLGVTARGDDVRAAALERFTRRVGTPLAEQTIGLVTGALDVGSDPETAFDTLQAEVGRLYHERKALQARLLAYVAVGWTTAVLVVGVTIAVNLYVLSSFEQLATVGQSMGGFVLDPDAVDPVRDQFRFYLVAQATMLGAGWFAGYANRGRYDALLQSGALVALAYAAFTLTGAV